MSQLPCLHIIHILTEGEKDLTRMSVLSDHPGTNLTGRMVRFSSSSVLPILDSDQANARSGVGSDLEPHKFGMACSRATAVHVREPAVLLRLIRLSLVGLSPQPPRRPRPIDLSANRRQLISVTRFAFENVPADSRRIVSAISGRYNELSCQTRQ
jgi:hypothetical protein